MNTPQLNERIIPYPAPAASAVAAPFDFTAGEPERFPIRAFPDSLRAIAEQMHRVYQAPVCLPAMSILAVISGAVGKSVVVQGGYKDKATRLNLYVIPVAERGSGKGTIGETLIAPLIRRSRELVKIHSANLAKKRAELGTLKREVQKNETMAAGKLGAEREEFEVALTKNHERIAELEIEAAREKTLCINNATSEALGRALADNGEALFSYSSEGGAVVKVALGKYTDQGDFDLLLSSYSGDTVRVNRIGRGVVNLENPCLALLWMVQGCVIVQLVTHSEAFACGLTARPLIFESGARREHDDRQTDTFSHGKEWSAFLDKILDERISSRDPRVIPCSEEAREVFAEFHDYSVDLEHDVFPDLTGELSRWRENAIKIAGVFAIAEGVETISADLAGRAVAVVRWCGANYLGLLQDGRRERRQKDLGRLLDLLHDHGGEMRLGELASRHALTREKIDALIAVFPTHLMVERRPQVGPGRPGEFLRALSKPTKPTKSA